MEVNKNDVKRVYYFASTNPIESSQRVERDGYGVEKKS